jgi:hypothetical protein
LCFKQLNLKPIILLASAIYFFSDFLTHATAVRQATGEYIWQRMLTSYSRSNVLFLNSYINLASSNEYSPNVLDSAFGEKEKYDGGGCQKRLKSCELINHATSYHDRVGTLLTVNAACIT